MEIPHAGELRGFSYAERAAHQQGEWTLDQVRITRLEGRGAVSEAVERLVHPSSISGDFVRLASRTPEDLSTFDLFHYARFLERSGIDANQYWHTFWSRIAAPFGLMVMLILTLPFSVTEGRSLSASRRLVMGIFLGIGFYLMNRVLLNTGEIFQFNPVATAFAIPLLFLAVALWMIQRRGL